MFSGSIDKQPAFTAYCERLFARPASARARADALIAEQKKTAGA